MKKRPRIDHGQDPSNRGSVRSWQLSHSRSSGCCVVAAMSQLLCGTHHVLLLFLFLLVAASSFAEAPEIGGRD